MLNLHLLTLIAPFRFGVNWLHLIFRRIVLEAAQIWRDLTPHYFPADYFGGGSDLAGNGSTLFSGGLFWSYITEPRMVNLKLTWYSVVL